MIEEVFRSLHGIVIEEHYMAASVPTRTARTNTKLTQMNDLRDTTGSWRDWLHATYDDVQESGAAWSLGVGFDT